MIRPYYNAPYFYRIHRSGELKTIALYLTTGAIVTAVDYGLFVLFYNFLPSGLLLATGIAYVGGLVTSYLLSRYWVFRKRATGQGLGTGIMRYISLLILNFVITYCMLWAMLEWWGLTPLIGKFVVGFFMIFWVYWADKVWVFHGPRQFRAPEF